MASKMTPSQIVGLTILLMLELGTLTKCENLKPLDWDKIVEDMGYDKKVVCNSLKNGNFPEDLDTIMGMYDKALANIGQSVEFSVLAQPNINPKMLSKFDENGRNLVLKMTKSRENVVKLAKVIDSGKVGEKVSKDMLNERFQNACHYLIDSYRDRENMSQVLTLVQ